MRKQSVNLVSVHLSLSHDRRFQNYLLSDWQIFLFHSKRGEVL